MIPNSRKRIAEGFEKEWVLPDKFRSPKLTKRLKLIEACGKLSAPSFPTIHHLWLRDRLYQKMPLLKKLDTSGVPAEKMKGLLMQLAHDIECIHAMGLLHGDIHPKNILYTGVELKLIDFEPILELESNGVQYYCSTRPWIAHEDLKNKKLSFLTDRIGFTHTAMRLFKIRIPEFSVVNTYRNRRMYDHRIGGLISDELVKKRNCSQILEYIYETFLPVLNSNE